MKNPWVLIVVITVVLFGGAIWFSSVANDKNNEGVELITHVKGNPDADIVLVEYSDLQCPACASFQPVVKGLLDEYGEQIRFEYKHFPLPIHPYAKQAAVAAEAAGQQDKFFEFHDLLFENQQTWSSSPVPITFFVQYAEELELDIELFERHMNSSILKEKVNAELAEARAAGANSTPSFYLNGTYLDPNEFQTFEGFVQRVIREIDPEAATQAFGTSSAPGGPGVRFGI